MINESAVNRHLSPADQMLTGSADAREHYFSCGRSALECIRQALSSAAIEPDRIKRILDLPCGHGRVLRYLKAAFPEAEIVACDLLRDAVDFCSSTFGSTAVYSCEEPEAIPLNRGSFDLIWVGSLFTHVDALLWPRFLAVLRDSLCPGGVLVFTTHGRAAYRYMVGGREYGIEPRRRTMLSYRFERTGFSYANYSGSESHYGVALSHPAWVVGQLTALGGLRLVSLAEASWDHHQDVFACVREAASETATRPTSRLRYWRHTGLDRMDPRLRSLLEAIWGRWLRRLTSRHHRRTAGRV